MPMTDSAINGALRTVYFVSDGTGITAETLGHSVLTQFESLRYKRVRAPFIDSVQKARDPEPVKTTATQARSFEARRMERITSLTMLVV